ncbi:metal ABC transporter ATP-binding protein [Patescibacteria group bacterium]|nr:metal ABC transporter ATP-binding protein [Patescibacteria group bacterium]MBU2035908.1 metal ABC transporter ATP-binding protein [Patescibacteria group bacterium]
MNNLLLEVKNLTVNLDGKKIIENLSFQVNQGEILTILGPNGAGKSVLLKTLLGFLPYKGKIVWQKKHKIGYLPQGLNQLKVKDFPLTVEDFFALKNSPPTSKETSRFLSLVGLEKEILTKRASSLSSGQFQRMLVAWVLISHPQIIFFDEPATGIDIGGGETIYSLLHSIQEKEKLTIFLVTHDLSIVYKYSTNVLCLSRKGHNCFGAPRKILNPKTLEDLFGTEIKFYEHH